MKHQPPPPSPEIVAKVPRLHHRIRAWYHQRRLDKAIKVITDYGLTPVRLREIAGSIYIIDAQGALHKVGTGESKADVIRKAAAKAGKKNG